MNLTSLNDFLTLSLNLTNLKKTVLRKAMVVLQLSLIALVNLQQDRKNVGWFINLCHKWFKVYRTISRGIIYIV